MLLRRHLVAILGTNETKIDLLALHQETFLVSGSGDGTLRLWNYLKGKEMDQVLVAQDANLQPLEEQVDPKTHRTPWPSVLDVQEFETQLAVSLEAFRGILLYQIQEEKLNFNRKVSIQSELWSFRFLNSNELIFIQAQCLKITQNVAFEFFNFGIFHQFLSY